MIPKIVPLRFDIGIGAFGSGGFASIASMAVVKMPDMLKGHRFGSLSESRYLAKVAVLLG